MNVSDQGNGGVASGGKFAANIFQGAGIFDARCGDAHDLAADISQADALFDCGRDVLGQRGAHRLQHDRGIAADLHGSHHHGATGAALIGKTVVGVDSRQGAQHARHRRPIWHRARGG